MVLEGGAALITAGVLVFLKEGPGFHFLSPGGRVPPPLLSVVFYFDESHHDQENKPEKQEYSHTWRASQPLGLKGAGGGPGLTVPLTAWLPSVVGQSQQPDHSRPSAK